MWHSETKLDRAFRNLGAAPHHDTDAEEAYPPQLRTPLVRKREREREGFTPSSQPAWLMRTGDIMQCSGLPPAVHWLAGAEGSALGDLRGLLIPEQ